MEFSGCGDNSCLCVKPTSMATNGGCRCHELHPKQAISFLLKRIRELEKIIEIYKQFNSQNVNYNTPCHKCSTDMVYTCSHELGDNVPPCAEVKSQNIYFTAIQVLDEYQKNSNYYADARDFEQWCSNRISKQKSPA